MVAIFEKDLLVKECQLAGDSGLSKILLPSIQALLQSCNLNLSKISYIAVGIGPGSYTGTRVGATVAKTLSFALNIPLIPFCSPLAFLPFHEGSFATVLPRKQGDLFLLKGEIRAGALTPGYTHKYIPPCDLASELQGITHTPSETPILALSTLAPYLHSKFLKKEYNLSETADLLYFSELK